MKTIFNSSSIDKVSIDSLFSKGGTIDNLDNFKQYHIVESVVGNTVTKNILYARIVGNYIQFVYKNKVVSKKFIESDKYDEYLYRVQKSQVQAVGDILENSTDTTDTCFKSSIVREYFTKK